MAIISHESQAPSHLQTLHEALTTKSLSGSALTEHSVYSTTDGISLLDVKNELLLAYLQDLVLLMILKLRQYSPTSSELRYNATSLVTDSIKRLVEIRVYAEKGVQPLEGRLRYQIDKVIKVADESQKASGRKISRPPTLRERSKTADDTKASSDGQHEDGSSQGSQTHSDADSLPLKPNIDDLSYRPNPANLLRKNSNKPITAMRQSAVANHTEGAYRPPRIQPTAMPEPNRRVERRDRGPRKSALVDEYVASELSNAPLAEPSIGSGNTILERGRNAMGRRERADEKERRDYEESNFVRLPGESKAEKRKRRRMDSLRGKGDEYGGEDWSGLGGLGDRIARVTGSVKGSASLLERNRKRTSSTGDDSKAKLGVGEVFEKRRKVLQDREARRKRR